MTIEETLDKDGAVVTDPAFAAELRINRQAEGRDLRTGRLPYDPEPVTQADIDKYRADYPDVAANMTDEDLRLTLEDDAQMEADERKAAAMPISDAFDIASQWIDDRAEQVADFDEDADVAYFAAGGLLSSGTKAIEFLRANAGAIREALAYVAGGNPGGPTAATLEAFDALDPYITGVARD